MSIYEKHVGKLKRIDLSKYDNNIEKFFEEQYRKTFTKKSEEEIQDAYEIALDYISNENSGPWESLFRDDYSYYFMEDKYYVVNGIIYEVIEEEELGPYGDISILKDNGDGTYNYSMTFYNGISDLRDCIEDELEKIG